MVEPATTPATGGPSATSAGRPPAAAPTPPLTDAQRADMIAGVDRMIHQRIRDAGIEFDERDDYAQTCRLELWRASTKFIPGGGASWPTFARNVIDIVIRREKCGHFERNGNAAGPTVRFADLAGPGRSVRLDETPDPNAVEPGTEDDADPLDDDQTSDVVRAVRMKLFEDTLNTLTDGHRRLVEMVGFRGLTVAQIAEQLGHPAKAVKANLMSAVRTLAAAGKVPADIAARLGIDAAELAAKAQGPEVKKRVMERRGKVRELLDQGLKVPQIAERLGEPESTIHHDSQIVRGAAKRAAAEPRVAELLRLGLTPQQVADQLRVSKGLVFKVRERFVAEAARKAAWEAKAAAVIAYKDRVVELHQAGRRAEEIAADVGRPVGAVFRVLRQLRTKSKHATPALDRVRKLLAAGYDPNRIAAETGSTRQAVMHHLRTIRRESSPAAPAIESGPDTTTPGPALAS